MVPQHCIAALAPIQNILCACWCLLSAQQATLGRAPRALADFLTSVQLSELVPDGEQGSAAESPGVSVSSLQQLLTQGLAIPLQLNSLDRLQAILQGHQAWEAHMQHLLQGVHSDPMFPEIL